MTDMIERVAKAINACTDKFDAPVQFYVEDEARQRWLKDHPDDSPDEAGIDWKVESYKIIARAAIEAMREPTPNMIAAGNIEIVSPGEDGDYLGTLENEEARECWQAMIDAALKAPHET